VLDSGRGGYGVKGLALGDLLPGATNQGDELVVTCLSGDLLVLSAGNGGGAPLFTELYRTWVEGAVGVANSIVIADLDAGAPGKELYVAGSLGIRKFIQPSSSSK